MTALVMIVLVSASQSENTIKFTVLHTDDMHSHFEGTGPDHSLNDESVRNGNNKVVGHYARLLTLIRKIRSAFKHTLLLGEFLISNCLKSVRCWGLVDGYTISDTIHVKHSS